MISSSVSAQTAAVLIIDAEPANQRALRTQLLRLGYSTRSADDYEAAAVVLDATPPDVVLLVAQPESGARWDSLQALLNNWGIPVVTLREGTAIQLDLANPLLPDAELKRRIEAALHSRKMHEALVMENARLSAERLYDPLTGLFNRRYMMIRVEEEVRRSARHGYPLSCLLLDVDMFDEVNEKWGNPVGDVVLRELSHIVTRTLRATDVVARYRDDEYIALLTDTSATGAQVAANRIRDAISTHQFANPVSDEPIALTASVGVAYWEPGNQAGESTWEPQLIALAERAVKAAKLSGRNRLVMLQAS